MKRSELENYLGEKVVVHFKPYLQFSHPFYIGILTKCSCLTPEKNLYYCKGVFSMETRFRSSYVNKVVEVTHE